MLCIWYSCEVWNVCTMKEENTEHILVNAVALLNSISRNMLLPHLLRGSSTPLLRSLIWCMNTKREIDSCIICKKRHIKIQSNHTGSPYKLLNNEPEIDKILVPLNENYVTNSFHLSVIFAVLLSLKLFIKCQKIICFISLKMSHISNNFDVR
jgi:hypothetical protein